MPPPLTSDPPVSPCRVTNITDGRAAAMKVIRLRDQSAVKDAGDEAGMLAQQLDCCLGLEVSLLNSLTRRCTC